MASTLFNIVGKLLKGKEDFSRLEGLEIRNIGGNTAHFKELKRTLLLLPDSLLNFMRVRDVCITYTGNPELFEKYGATGLYYSDNNHIMLYDGCSLNWQKESMIHEIGHFIDFNLVIGRRRWLSKSSRELHATTNESNIHFKLKFGEGADYYINDITETFAQGFVEYILDQKTYFTRCEHQGQFFDSILARIELHYGNHYFS